MVRNAQQTAANARQSTANNPGMCLEWSRERADIGPLHPNAATAWKHAHHRHPGDRHPPEGAAVYWLGGSKGYGHIAISLGGGKVRSSDAGGTGEPATVDLSWPEQEWNMPYAGWADNINDVVIPGVGGGEDEMPQYDHASTGKAQNIKAGEWQAIVWPNVASGPAIKAGDNVAKLGGRKYTASLKVTVDAITGTTIRLQCVELASGQIEETNPQTEVTATSGKTYGSHSQIGVVKSGRNLRWRVTASADCTLLAADVTVLSW